MPRYLAIDWDECELRLVSANIQGPNITVDRIVSEPINSETNLAEKLTQTIAQHKIRATEALIGVPRSAVELRPLVVPAVPDEELPGIIRFQAMREFSELSEDWPIDYLATSTSEEGIHVKAAAISPDRVNQLTQPVVDAGLTPVGLILRPTAIAALVAFLDPDEKGVRLAVDVLDRYAELTVIEGSNIHLMRTIHLPDSDAAEEKERVLLSEILRTKVAASNQLRVDVESILFFGMQEPRSRLIEQSRSRFKLEATCIDPLAAVSITSKARQTHVDSVKHAAAIGMLCEEASDQHYTIDLLRPRRPAEAPSRTRLYVLAGLAATCCLLAGLFAIWYQLWTIDTEITGLRNVALKKKKEAAQATEKIENVTRLNDWERSAVNWVDELERLSIALPPAEKIRLTQVNGDIKPTGNGFMNLQGFVSDPQVIDEIDDQLTDEKHIVQTANVEENGVDKRYPLSVKKTVTIVNFTADELENRKKNRRGIIRRRTQVQ